LDQYKHAFIRASSCMDSGVAELIQLLSVEDNMESKTGESATADHASLLDSRGNLSDLKYLIWKKLTISKGTPPTSRSSHTITYTGDSFVMFGGNAYDEIFNDFYDISK